MKAEINKEFIEQNWPLTEVEIGNTLQESGNRIVGLIESQQGKFVYKIADEWKTTKALKRDLTAFDYLNEYGFKHIPIALKTKHGKDFETMDGQFIYLMDCVEGKQPAETPETYAKLGKITAELHKVKGFPSETDFQAKIVIEDLKKNSKNYTFGKEYLEIVSNLPNFESLPKALIHTDISPGNSIQEENGNIILLDWDDVGIGVRVLDIGQPLGHFVSEDLEFFEDNARAFYGAYFKQIKLTEEEMKHIFDAGLFYALMYIIYGDLDKRWNRIKWSLENRDKLEKVIRDSAK